MILDTLDQSACYRALGPRFAAGLQWLEGFSPAMADGRYDIAGDDVFASVQSYETVPAAQKKYEAHRVYADIQYIAEGAEQIYYAPTATLSPATAYDQNKDYLLFAEPEVATPLVLAAGSFAIFYPQDAHKPGCIQHAAARIKKVVIKARL